MHEYPTEVRADLQRYYGLNLSHMGATFDSFHAAACLVCLPLGSSTMARIRPECAWTVTDYSLHSILCALVGKAIPFPWDMDGSMDDGVEIVTTELSGFATKDEYLAWESQEWEDVDGRQFCL